MGWMGGFVIGFLACFGLLWLCAQVRERRARKGPDEKVQMGERIVAVVGKGDGRRVVID